MPQSSSGFQKIDYGDSGITYKQVGGKSWYAVKDIWRVFGFASATDAIDFVYTHSDYSFIRSLQGCPEGDYRTMVNAKGVKHLLDDVGATPGVKRNVLEVLGVTPG